MVSEPTQWAIWIMWIQSVIKHTMIRLVTKINVCLLGSVQLSVKCTCYIHITGAQTCSHTHTHTQIPPTLLPTLEHPYSTLECTVNMPLSPTRYIYHELSRQSPGTNN